MSEPDFLLEVSLDKDISLDSYDKAFSSYREWISLYRDIKLNYLLEEGKRLQFDIDNISKFIKLDNDEFDVNVRDICASVSGMTFILNNGKVEKLTLKTHIIKNQSGETLRNLLNEGLDIKIKQFLLEDHLHFVVKI